MGEMGEWEVGEENGRRLLPGDGACMACTLQMKGVLREVDGRGNSEGE